MDAAKVFKVVCLFRKGFFLLALIIQVYICFLVFFNMLTTYSIVLDRIFVKEFGG
jgi:hypothetical protein